MGPACCGVLSRAIHVMFVTPPSVLGMVEGNELRALALTGTKPFPQLPDVPLMQDQIPGYPATGSWGMFLAPSGTPGEIIARLNAAVRHAVRQPAVANVVQRAGYIPDERSPAETAAFFRAEVDAAGVAVAIAGIKPN